MNTKDILGKNMTPTEVDLVAIYEQLKALQSRADLAPCAQAAVHDALVAMWNAVNDLQLRFEAEM
jgi:hypothetical protein